MEDCSICLLEISERDLYITKCNHKYHISCICSAVNRKRTCPNCRANISDTEIKSIIKSVKHNFDRFDSISTAAAKSIANNTYITLDEPTPSPRPETPELEWSAVDYLTEINRAHFPYYIAAELIAGGGAPGMA
jgi:hypothetical protein